jgi:hypothetical protein
MPAGVLASTQLAQVAVEAVDVAPHEFAALGRALGAETRHGVGVGDQLPEEIAVDVV